MKQRTINSAVSIEGVGLHTGKNVKLTFKPAIANHGYKFQRVDLDGQPIIPADVRYVVHTTRGTTLKSGEAIVSTVEHALSALYGLDIDNVLIEIDGPEVPILDGSAREFVKMITTAGIVEQDAERSYFEITEPIRYKDEQTGSELLALPAEEFKVTTLIDFDSDTLGQQFASLDSIDEYQEQISPCRTFVFLHELEHLFEQNLIRGGDLDNAIVIVDRVMSDADLERLGEKLGKTDVKVEKTGVLNTVDLQFKNEPARHKLLDVIGDLALVGAKIKGRILATKPGHTVNIAFAKELKKHIRDKKKLKGKPNYDPNADPLVNVAGIQKLLPHRYPFLLIDKVVELADERVVAVKSVTFNEYFFQGHFPNNPVMPGVLQIEALAQTGGILALSTVEDPENWDTYFLKIDNAKFKRKVIPGDTLLFKMELLAPIRRGIVQMQGTTYVGDHIASEAELTAQIVRRTSI